MGGDARPRRARRGARARVRRARPLAAGDPRRPARRRLRGRGRRRAPVPPDPGLREPHVARAGRAHQAVPRQARAVPALRDRAGHPLDAAPPRRSAVGRLAGLRLRRGVHDRRRQHRPLHRQEAARGHDPQEQPRGRGRGRAPAAAARCRRHHRDRLHRHGLAEEPRRRAEDDPEGAREGSLQELRRRDLAARTGRDDAPQRDRRRARDPDRGAAATARARAASCRPSRS